MKLNQTFAALVLPCALILNVQNANAAASANISLDFSQLQISVLSQNFFYIANASTYYQAFADIDTPSLSDVKNASSCCEDVTPAIDATVSASNVGSVLSHADDSLRSANVSILSGFGTGDVNSDNRMSLVFFEPGPHSIEISIPYSFSVSDDDSAWDSGYTQTWVYTDLKLYKAISLSENSTYFDWSNPSAMDFFSASADLGGNIETGGGVLHAVFDINGEEVAIVTNLRAQAITGMAAVPIPTTAWLFGSGLLGLLGFKRRTSVG